MSGPPVLAIAIDAAESTLVDRLLTRGELPVLSELIARGTRARVAPTWLGSPAVWPTFITGTDAIEHQTCFGSRWSPERMALLPDDSATLDPWWRRPSCSGARLLLLDVPYAPFGGGAEGFQVSEWGAYDAMSDRLLTHPPRLAREIRRDPGRHPYFGRRALPHHQPSPRQLRAMAAALREGVRLRGRLAVRLLRELRPDLALVTFTEVHPASHLLWHTVEPDHPLVAGAPRDGLGEPVHALLREVDDQVGRLIETAPADVTVAVFALHGMRPASGVAVPLGPLLQHLGFAAAPAGRALGPRDRALTAFAAAKRHAPERLRTAWRSTASPALQKRVARPTRLAPLDWERTRAFALPSDENGFVRINLAGREACGIVRPADYAAICDEVTGALLAQQTEDGRPLASRVLRVAEEYGSPPPAAIPDLVVHWEDAAHDDPLRIARSDIELQPDARRRTGRHKFDGWLVAAGLELPGEEVAARDLHRVLVGCPATLSGRGPVHEDGHADQRPSEDARGG